MWSCRLICEFECWLYYAQGLMWPKIVGICLKDMALNQVIFKKLDNCDEMFADRGNGPVAYVYIQIGYVLKYDNVLSPTSS